MMDDKKRLIGKHEWRSYWSEETDESWEIFVESTHVENEADVHSDSGRYATLGFSYKTIDYVVVSILPAARYKDPKDISSPLLKDKFYLHLHLLNGDEWFCLSKNHYDKEVAVSLASLFMGTNKNQAERVWKSKKLGPTNTYRR